MQANVEAYNSIVRVFNQYDSVRCAPDHLDKTNSRVSASSVESIPRKTLHRKFEYAQSVWQRLRSVSVKKYGLNMLGKFAPFSNIAPIDID